jgi:hypothetical protein
MRPPAGNGFEYVCAAQNTKIKPLKKSWSDFRKKRVEKLPLGGEIIWRRCTYLITRHSAVIMTFFTNNSLWHTPAHRKRKLKTVKLRKDVTGICETANTRREEKNGKKRREVFPLLCSCLHQRVHLKRRGSRRGNKAPGNLHSPEFGDTLEIHHRNMNT